MATVVVLETMLRKNLEKTFEKVSMKHDPVKQSTKSALAQACVSLKELTLSWHRVKADRPDRCFVIHPTLFLWIEADLQGWLGKIAGRLRDGYVPAGCQICYSPKPGWMVRPGALLDLEDEVVFNALLGHFHAEIWKAIGWSQGDPDIAYQFQKERTKVQWIRSDVRVWREWREKSLKKLQRGVQFVVSADIAAFYENVDLQRLRSDLSALGLHGPKLETLMTLLNRWAQPRGKGIPQGYSASDILAKIYMAPVDRALQNAGFIHLRYVDDIRIFCRDSLEAKRTLLKLNELLRSRGLNLQSAKTKIERVDDARALIDGIAPLIESIHEELKRDLKTNYADASGYGWLSDIDNIFHSHPDAPPPEVLERAFHDHFSAARDENFDKTLFHYLLTRLGRTKSRVAIAYCLQLLAHRPEETQACLRYFSEVELEPQQARAVLRYAASNDAIYDYQLYQIARWFWEQKYFPDELVALCRQWAFDRNREPLLRTYCILIIGAAGDHSDLEMLESRYDTATTELEKAELVTALARAETGRRNSFYGRVRNDGHVIKLAISSVKESSRPRKTRKHKSRSARMEN